MQSYRICAVGGRYRASEVSFFKPDEGALEWTLALVLNLG